MRARHKRRVLRMEVDARAELQRRHAEVGVACCATCGPICVY